MCGILAAHMCVICVVYNQYAEQHSYQIMQWQFDLVETHTLISTNVCPITFTNECLASDMYFPIKSMCPLIYTHWLIYNSYEH